MNKTIQLRPHHAICLNLFVGNGYSEEFVKYMNIINNLPDDEIIEIKFGLDSICEHCPNNLNIKCSSEDKVRFLDYETVKVCGFQGLEKITLKEFKLKGKEKIINTDYFDKICYSCEYYQFCKKLKEKR